MKAKGKQQINSSKERSLHDRVKSSIDDKKILSRDLVTEEADEGTFGERVADKVAAFGGSWTFILSFSGILIVWIATNALLLLNKGFDPYPFILLNLVLSCVAALQAPFIMMSQNRQEVIDRKRAENDYMINLKAEIEIRELHDKIDELVKRLDDKKN